MAITYYGIGKNRRLNEVVLMGSHDAAIDTGGSNTQTQTQDILGQATDGARFFDLRVAAFRTSALGGKVELRSYHDATLTRSPTLRLNSAMKVKDLGNQVKTGVKVHTNMLGAAGFGLQAMLQDAVTFLTNSTEFLIFKFDKSENWQLIVDVCRQELTGQGRDFLFTTNSNAGGASNLNIKTLEQLQGRLLILFPEAAFAKLGQADQLHREGFLKWRNLYSKESRSAKGYIEDFDGLQYYGKGGTSASAYGGTAKIALNTTAQTRLMQGSGAYKVDKDGWKGKLGMKDKGRQGDTAGSSPADRRAVGLMYWTTTGVSLGGIENRNNRMWTDIVLTRMVNVAKQDSDPSVHAMGEGSIGAGLKPFMPNIIMVDFVDNAKGDTIYKMNFNSTAKIGKLAKAKESIEEI